MKFKKRQLYIQLFILNLLDQVKPMQKTGFKNVDNCDPRLCINGKISRAKRIVNGVFRKRLKPFGITSSQLSMLFILSKKGKTSQRELADMLYLEKSSVSRNKRRLVTQGWVENEGLNLIIAKKGLSLLDQIIPAWDEAMDEIKLKLGKEGQVGLDSMLGSLISV